ncbi:MAG: DNA-processing protein DprA [Thermoguttaceae bacterium]|nr:DNA-processing protein DprA [Thermoguttaceae bacterium]MDW8039107.1 DNA-processing protein DprA [Thermoguttaceae bacterium]
MNSQEAKQVDCVSEQPELLQPNPNALNQATQTAPLPELLDELALALVPGVGPRTRLKLLEYFGSVKAVLEASAAELQQVPDVGPKLALAIRSAEDRSKAQQVWSICRQHGIQVLCQTDPEYPELLKQIADPPAVLFVRGELLPRDQLAIAIVGTRHPSLYGLRQAERLAGSLARAGLTIISGLARGIDAAAHRGALAAGGRTLAVLANGVIDIYPPEHKNLAEQIIAHGALLSETPPGTQPLAGMFPQRNRLISGLALGVLVVEAPHRSGALITARHALEQNREVFAVPGRIDEPTSHGCHQLIRDGAKLVESAEDILEELGPLVQPTVREDGRPIRHPAELLLNPTEEAVLQAIGTDPTDIDQIVRTTGLPVPRVLASISVLEMRHLVRRLSGSSVVRR